MREVKTKIKKIKAAFPLQGQPSSYIPNSSTFPALRDRGYTQCTTAPLCCCFLLTVLVCYSLDSQWTTACSVNSQMSQCRVLHPRACKESPALVPRVAPSFFTGLGVHSTAPHSIFHLPLLPECWFCLFFNMLPQRHHHLSHKAVSGPAAPRCQSIVMNTSSFCLFIFFHFPFLSPLSFYFPIFCLGFLSFFLILLPVSSYFLSRPPHLHPVTSCSDKRIFLLKHKCKRILNLFYEARTTEIPKFNFSFVHFYSKPKKMHYILCLLIHQSSGKSPVSLFLLSSFQLGHNF